ncbi:MAG: outer membrane protein assembly factor BamD [Gammaproteobacteria bacterium]
MNPDVSKLFRIMLMLGVLALGTTGCSNSKSSIDPNEDARELFEKGERALNLGNYNYAVGSLEYLQAVYPFSEYAKQAQLDLMYAYYRAGEAESAIGSADQFLLENPTHPRVDYAHYVKGLVNFQPRKGPMERLVGTDPSQRPQDKLESSFRSFSVIANQYPDSPYAEDARQRMVYLRNQLARYEIHVANYYLRRGAFVASANRARYVLETYPQSESVVTALQIQVSAYRQLGLEELAADSMRVLKENYPDQAFAYGERGTRPEGTLIERFILRRNLK